MHVNKENFEKEIIKTKSQCLLIFGQNGAALA